MFDKEANDINESFLYGTNDILSVRGNVCKQRLTVRLNC